MYKNLTYGASNANYSVRTLDNALQRQKAYGAVFLTVPGPKMIWQFAELGYDKSIYTCEDGSVNTETDATPGDCKLDPKPSAFGLAYDSDAVRASVRDTWAEILSLRLANDVFNTTDFTVQSGNLMPKIRLSKPSASSALKDVVIVANFTLTTQNITPDFPYTGTWVNLMDNSSLVVSSAAASVSVEPGGFRIFGNASALGIDEHNVNSADVSLALLQNPVSNGTAKLRYSNAKNGTLSIYDLSGKLVNTVSLKTNAMDLDLDVRGLNAGMYLIQLKAENGTAVTKMIIR